MSDNMPDPAQLKYRRQRVIVIAAGALLLVFGCIVMLVLTGIIAEPETLIENVVRALSGGS